FTGVDTSRQMVALTRETLRRHGLEGRAEVHEGPAEVLPTDAGFDGATLLYVLHFLPDHASKLALLREVATRLVPGGLLVVGQHQAPSDARYAPLFQAAWESFMTGQGMTDEGRSAFLGRCRMGLFPITDEEFSGLVESAGFERPVPFFRALFQ